MRSGSRGLRNKNMKLINGKPLMYYTIKQAIKSKIFDIFHKFRIKIKKILFMK